MIIVGFHMTSLKFKLNKTIDSTEILLSCCIKAAKNYKYSFKFGLKRVLGFVIEYSWISKLLRECGICMTADFGEFCSLNSSFMRKRYYMYFQRLWVPWQTFLLVSSSHAGAWFTCTFLRISCIWNIALTSILARVFAYLPPFISQVLNFIYWTVLMLTLIYIE